MSYYTKPYVAYGAKSETIEAFTAGDCWALAVELRRLTGFPLAFANPFPEDEYYWEHVGLIVPGDQVLDVFGLWSTDAWVRYWTDYAGEELRLWNSSANYGELFVAETDESVADMLEGQTRRFPGADARALARRLLNTFRVPTRGRKQRDALPIGVGEL